MATSTLIPSHCRLLRKSRFTRFMNCCRRKANPCSLAKGANPLWSCPMQFMICC